MLFLPYFQRIRFHSGKGRYENMQKLICNVIAVYEKYYVLHIILHRFETVNPFFYFFAKKICVICNLYGMDVYSLYNIIWCGIGIYH